ncbi:hypothetical protein ASPZODRAFT_67533, partial [Penicilliopsis zonata CBS 506.65]
EGLKYLYLINGLMDVLLWVPYNNLGTLYYDLGDPGIYSRANIKRHKAPRT